MIKYLPIHIGVTTCAANDGSGKECPCFVNDQGWKCQNYYTDLSTCSGGVQRCEECLKELG